MALGVVLMGAGSAQAVTTVWGCNYLSSGPGTVYGSACSSHGGALTGVGYVFLEPAATIGWRCTSFAPVQDSWDQDYSLTGYGCTPHNS